MLELFGRDERDYGVGGWGVGWDLSTLDCAPELAYLLNVFFKSSSNLLSTRNGFSPLRVCYRISPTEGMCFVRFYLCLPTLLSVRTSWVSSYLISLHIPFPNAVE